MSGRAELESRMDALRELCRKHNVARLLVYGSVVRDDFDPDRSDIDFLVEFLPSLGRFYFDTYLDLKENLEGLFGRPVDLGTPDAIRHPYVLRSISNDQELLYAA